MLKKALDHEVRVFVSNGSEAHFTIREMYELYTSWQMWLLVLFGFFIMATGHPVTLPQFDSFQLRLAFWFVALFLYLTLSMFYALASCRIWRSVFGGPIPLIVLSSPLVLVSTCITVGALTVLFEPDKPAFASMTWQMNLRNVFVAHVFETVALLWLLPTQRARKVTMSAGRDITLAGRKFALAQISRVKAAEHYLEIYTLDAVETIRERMSTFLDQVSLDEGIQTHRSHWVARQTAQSLSGSKLTLTDGVTVPVARGRLDDVRAWMDMHTDPGRGGVV
ncbi:hypothetical protein GCM10007385_12660 [Tateyamaria omphalii]|uniref:LytTR family DNA-binding domain-containing protein n=1 Tax=Tateyamaria omphalii TaxID=299262 RepID=UPI0016793758|nr:LytTR family DNA-binding domain-containing protein [Tateyamaria omphalii]GGX46537.1 hypothetical protein GCM10007385_12660 [Tateyamaria omphalii]